MMLFDLDRADGAKSVAAKSEAFVFVFFFPFPAGATGAMGAVSVEVGTDDFVGISVEGHDDDDDGGGLSLVVLDLFRSGLIVLVGVDVEVSDVLSSFGIA